MKKHHIKPAFNILAIFVLALAMTLQAFFVPNVSAAQITNRKLTLMPTVTTIPAAPAAAPEGGAKPGATVDHFFEFTVPSTTAIGSVKFEYCTTAADVGTATCDTPTGLVTTGASLGDESLSDATGFSSAAANGSTPGVFVLTKASAAAPTNPRELKFRLDDVVNPTDLGTFFVRITTFNGTDGSTDPIDSGTVAASTSRDIIVQGTMPESLVFCTGTTVSKTLGVPDCSTVTTGSVAFNQLFSPTDTAAASSQMAASTNAGSGYVITVNGPTLTSGSNTIEGVATPGASVKGVAQFGLNLRANTIAAAPGFATPADPLNPPADYVASAGIDLPSTGAGLKAQATADYNVADTFKFVHGDVVANSADTDGDPDTVDTTLGPTDAQIYTVSYIANVPGSQAAGTYTSTLTYICTPTF